MVWGMEFATVDRLVKMKFTLFGLPFTLAGAILPFAVGTPELVWQKFVWIVMGFLGARMAGMALNDLIDRKIDAENPRTKGRVLPSGDMAPKQVLGIALAGLLIFGYACARISPLVLALAVPAALLIGVYPYTKRFTALCHFVLGAIHLMAPVMAWVAVTGEFAWPPVLLGGCALCTIVANDVVWALQDYQFDRETGLHSVPVKLGPVMALMLSRIFYAMAILCLTAAGMMADLAWPFYIGVLSALAAVMYYDRVLLRPGEEGIPVAFFRCNAVVAGSALFAVLLATLVALL